MKKAKLPHHVPQSILVSKEHGEVERHGAKGAAAVARRFGITPNSVVEGANYYEVRQVDPALIRKGSIVTQAMMGGLVKVRRGRLKPAIERAPLEMTGGSCERRGGASGRKILTCRERYSAGPLHVDVRTSPEEHQQMPEQVSIGQLMNNLGRSRLHVTTPKEAPESKILHRYR